MGRGQPRSLAERSRLIGMDERRQRTRDAALGYGDPYDDSDLEEPVYVRDGALERGGVASFHTNSGCYGARKPVERADAEAEGATACSVCFAEEGEAGDA